MHCLIMLKPNHVHVASRPIDLRVDKVRVGLNWAGGELGMCSELPLKPQ